MAKEKVKSQFEQGENSSFYKCLLFPSLVFRHWARYYRRSRNEYNFILNHKEFKKKKKKAYIFQ